MIEIDNAVNGIILRDDEGRCWTFEYPQECEEGSVEYHEANARFLRQLMDVIGVFNSKHDEARINIDVERQKQ